MFVGRYASNRKDFAADLENTHAELLEVKLSLNRGAIGQAIAGRHMFQRQYGVAPGCTTILCRFSDSALAWVCEQEKIRVEVVNQPRN